MSIAIVTDSSVYTSPAQNAELGLRIVPLTVTLGDWTFREPDVEPREFYARLATADERPSTSQPAPGEFLEVFQAAEAEGATAILCITCAAAISGTHQSATVAAGMVSSIPVEVVDSATISGGLLLYVGTVARAVLGGATLADALELCRSMSGRVWSTFVSGDLDLLVAGGRLDEDAAIGEGVPVLAMEGTMRSLGMARTIDEAVSWQADVIAAAAAQSPTRVTVGHGDVVHLADALEAALVGRPGVLGVDRYVVGPVVGAHVGRGNFGASYLAPPTAVASAD